MARVDRSAQEADRERSVAAQELLLAALNPGGSELTPEQFGLLLANVREQLRWTQAALAERVGVDRKTVDNWEHGRTSPRNRRGALFQIISEAVAVDLQDGEAGKRGGPTVSSDEFRALLVLLRDRIEREPNASDEDRARWRARVAELEADMLGDPEQRAG